MNQTGLKSSSTKFIEPNGSFLSQRFKNLASQNLSSLETLKKTISVYSFSLPIFSKLNQCNYSAKHRFYRIARFGSYLRLF